MQKTELSYLQNCQFHSVLLKDFLKRPIKKKLIPETCMKRTLLYTRLTVRKMVKYSIFNFKNLVIFFISERC